MMNVNNIKMGVLRVLTLEDPEEVSLHGQVIERHLPNVKTDSRCIPEHPDGIPNAAAEAGALPHIESLGREMAVDVDVLCISCALDPGVDTLDDELDIPVVGPGAGVVGGAFSRGTSVGTLGLESGTPSNVRNLLGENHQASEVVEGAETTNYLTTREGRTEIRNAVDRLADAGCDVVAPCCTGITTSGALANLKADLSIPVVDPVLAMAAMGLTALFPVETQPVNHQRSEFKQQVDQ